MDTTICSRGGAISGAFNKPHNQSGKKNKVPNSSSVLEGKGGGGSMVVPSGIPKFNAISSKRQQSHQANQYDNANGYSCNGIEGAKMAPRFETYMMTGDLILNIDPTLPHSTLPSHNGVNLTLVEPNNNDDNDENRLNDLQRVDYVVDGSVTLVVDSEGDRFHNGCGNKFGSGDTYIYPCDNGDEGKKSIDEAQLPALPAACDSTQKCKGDWPDNCRRSLPCSPVLKQKEKVVEPPVTKTHNDVTSTNPAPETSKTKLAALRENIEKHRLKNRLQNSLLQMNPDNPKVTNGLPANDLIDPSALFDYPLPDNDLIDTIQPSHPLLEKGQTNQNISQNEPLHHTYVASADQEIPCTKDGGNIAPDQDLPRKPKPSSGRRQAKPNQNYKSLFDQNKTLDLGGAHQHHKTGVDCDFDTFTQGSPPNFAASLAAENNVSVSCQTLCFELFDTIPPKVTSNVKKGKTNGPTAHKSSNSKGDKAYKSARYDRKSNVVAKPRESVGPHESHQIENRLLWTVNNDRDMEMIAAAAAASNAFASHYDQHGGASLGPDSINFIRNEEQKRTSERLLKIERRKRLVEQNKLKKLQREQQQQLPPEEKIPSITNDHAPDHNELISDKNVRDVKNDDPAKPVAPEQPVKPYDQDSNQRCCTLSPSKSSTNVSCTTSGSGGKASYSSVTSSPSNLSSKSSSSSGAVHSYDTTQQPSSLVEPSLILTNCSSTAIDHPSSEYYIIGKQAAQRFLTVFESTSRLPPTSTSPQKVGRLTEPMGLDKHLTEVLLSASSPFYGTEAECFIKRLFRLDGVDKVQVAQYLNFMADTNERLAEEFVNEFFFEKIPLDVALRNFFLHVSLVGENCDREKTLRIFSKYYYQFNPTSFISEDALHILVCALVLLNTDFYLCDIGKKMSCKEFITNLTSMGNYAKSYDKSYLKKLYYSIKEKPLQGITKTDSIQSQASECQSFVEQNPYLTVPPPYLNENIIVKQGFLRRKCYQDGNGRKSSFVRRNWKTFFAVLRGRILYLNKGCNVYDNALGNDYNSIRLHHALAQKSSEYIRKPFVFQLQTADWAIYFFQAGNLQDMEGWIESINLIAATFSALPLPSAIGCQKKFHRPLLPSLPTKHNMVEQFKQHESMVKELEKEINLLRENPPAPQWKSREIVEFKERENYYLYELKRYKTYSILLQRKLSKKDNTSLKESSFHQVDPAKLNKKSEPQKNIHFNSTKIDESKNGLLPPKTLSDRYSYKAAIYKTETERNYF